MRLNPYDFPAYLERVKTAKQDRFECYSDDFKAQERDRDELSALLHSIPRKTVNRLLNIMRIESADGWMYRCLARLESDLIKRNSAVMERIGLSGEDVFDFFHDMPNAAQYISGSTLNQIIDFQDLLDFRNSLPVDECVLIDAALELITNLKPADLFSPIDDHYCRPLKTVVAEERIISGRTFVKEFNGYVRDYLACSKFTVKQVASCPYIDDNGCLDSRKESLLVGCGSNLYQAIEVSLLSLKKANENKKTNYLHNYKIYSKGSLYLEATVERGDSDEFILAWCLPPSQVERDELVRKLERIRIDYAENSRADNYSTCSSLSEKINSIETRLKEMPLNKETIMSSVDYVERIMGTRSFIRRQLSYDLEL